jgi:hypothetical protein
MLKTPQEQEWGFRPLVLPQLNQALNDSWSMSTKSIQIVLIAKFRSLSLCWLNNRRNKIKKDSLQSGIRLKINNFKMSFSNLRTEINLRGLQT